ncbi:hypothetical protein FRC02_000908 [Tulasnella sp. 418]|nr:hypothetical protein FRC02_000908 [Tulasnella sp. 418]
MMRTFILISLIYSCIAFVTSTPINKADIWQLSPRGSSYEYSSVDGSSDGYSSEEEELPPCPSEESLLPLYLGKEVTDNIRKATQLYAFPNKVATDIELIGKGRAGCAYALKRDNKILAVAKTPRGHNVDINDLKKEIEGLTKINELYGHLGIDQDINSEGSTPSGQWIFMKYVPGVPLHLTNQYKRVIRKPKNYVAEYNKDEDVSGEKKAYYQMVAEDIGKAARLYCRKYGILHDDIHFQNILFDVNYPQSGSLPQFIDWGRWRECQDPEVAYKWTKEDVYWRLEL